MKIGSYIYNGKASYGVKLDDGIVDLGRRLENGTSNRSVWPKGQPSRLRTLWPRKPLGHRTPHHVRRRTTSRLARPASSRSHQSNPRSRAHKRAVLKKTLCGRNRITISIFLQQICILKLFGACLNKARCITFLCIEIFIWNIRCLLCYLCEFGLCRFSALWVFWK